MSESEVEMHQMQSNEMKFEKNSAAEGSKVCKPGFKKNPERKTRSKRAPLEVD